VTTLRRAILVVAVVGGIACRKNGEQWVVLPEKEALKLTEPCSRPFPRSLSGYWKLGDVEIARAEVRFQEALRQVLGSLPSDERDAVPAVYYAQYAGFFRNGHKVVYVNAVGYGEGWKDRAILLCDGGVISFGAVLDLDRDSVDSFEFNGTMAGPIRMGATPGDPARQGVAGAPLATAAKCPAVVQSLASVSTFSTLFGATGCLTSDAKAFLVIHEAGDIEGLRALARAPSAAAQLYALCGLKHLHVEPDASALRRELSSSSKKTTIEFGDPEPLNPTAVSSLVVAKKGQPSSEFDSTCDMLVGVGRNPRAPARRTCSSESAHLTCR